MEPKVIVRDLVKRYRGVEAVRGVTFTVAAGEIFGLLGVNGAGKTSTLECLTGLREADGGELRVAGVDVRADPAGARARLGVALQATALQDQVTPREALRLFGALYPRASEPATLLERFGLVEKADARFGTLSGGQRQKLALALAFVNQPEVVLLDEPTTGLDAHARRELHAEILRLRREGCTVLLTTHYLAEAEALCDRVAIIDRGRIVATGSPRELIAASGVKATVRAVTDRPVDPAAVAGLRGFDGGRVEGTILTLATAQPAAALAALGGWLASQGVELRELQVEPASLEDVFVGLTRGGEAA